MRSPSLAKFESFESIKARYVAALPLAKLELAKNPSQLLDRVIQYKLFLAPRRDYRSVLVEVLETDAELKQAYNA